MQNSERNDHIERALEALNAGRANDTLTLCQSVLEANMNDAEAWSIYGLAGLQFEPERGIQALQRAVQLEPTEPRWQIHLGVAFGKIAQDVESEQVLQSAVELTDSADEAMIPWANSLLRLGQLDKATSALRETAKKKKSPALWMHLSNILSANDDLIGSVSAREQAYAGMEIRKIARRPIRS
jgi:Flp pilus assembly protein TadD